MKKYYSTTRGCRTRLRPAPLFSRLCPEIIREYEVGTAQSFSQLAKRWWDTLASRNDWMCAAELGQLSATLCPHESFGWENWAWALHKQGQTREAYQILAPLLKKLTLPGPPSGRAAYCLACFSSVLGRAEEALRWLKLAELRAFDKEAFRLHAFREIDLREFWSKLEPQHEA